MPMKTYGEEKGELLQEAPNIKVANKLDTDRKRSKIEEW